MPHGHVTFAADEANADLLEALCLRFGADPHDNAAPDVLLSSGVPDRAAGHVVITGSLTDGLDAWDRDVPPQTVAGALWVVDGQDAFDVVCAWWALRRETPTTPLSDLTDRNERALRWSVVAARSIALADDAPVAVDDAEIRAWLDDQAEVQELGRAIDRIGGDGAEAVLDTTDRFRSALRGLDALADLPPADEPRELNAAIAEHLRQVQRTGLGRWRGARARAESQAATTAAAKSAAADRLRVVIEARREELTRSRRAAQGEHRAERIVTDLADAVAQLELPCHVDFGRVPRSWTDDAPAPRRYVLLHEEQAEAVGEIPGATVRSSPDVPQGSALCMIVQSGFSLPAIREPSDS